jgi:Ser/Thr protein kinase RdoA (MazF antagonist)
VHGDEHPGNVRGDATQTVFLDWGDAFVGNPVFDVIGLTTRASAADTEAITQAWVAWWRRSAPGSAPERAAELARPLAALRLAAVYAHFVANIEPTERAFHLGDIRDLLDRAVTSAG